MIIIVFKFIEMCLFFYENLKRRVIFKKIISKKGKIYIDWMMCYGLIGWL